MQKASILSCLMTRRLFRPCSHHHIMRAFHPVAEGRWIPSAQHRPVRLLHHTSSREAPAEAQRGRSVARKTQDESQKRELPEMSLFTRVVMGAMLVALIVPSGDNKTNAQEIEEWPQKCQSMARDLEGDRKWLHIKYLRCGRCLHASTLYPRLRSEACPANPDFTNCDHLYLSMEAATLAKEDPGFSQRGWNARMIMQNMVLVRAPEWEGIPLISDIMVPVESKSETRK